MVRSARAHRVAVPVVVLLDAIVGVAALLSEREQKHRQLDAYGARIRKWKDEGKEA